MGQMKQRDARIFAMCQHLRAAIDIWEQIASEPFQVPEKATLEPSRPTAPTPPADLRTEKLMYTVKEAAAALGVGRTTLYEALSSGALSAVKLGNRTLIPADGLRRWIDSWPERAGRRGS